MRFGAQEMSDWRAELRRALGRMSDEGGFTLAELLVVIVLMALFLTAVGGMLNSGVKGSSSNYALVKLQERGNEVISVITRQLREAVAISPQSTSSSITFMYLVAEGTQGSAARTAGYDLADGFLRKRPESGTGMVNWMDGCEALEFTYWVYDDEAFQLRPWDGSQTGEHLEIKRIDIRVTLSAASLGGEGLVRTFTGSATLRNDLQDLL